MVGKKEEEFAIFRQSHFAVDQRVISLRQKHGLPINASLQEIETKATELLNNPLTTIEGAELVMGRRVAADDPILREIASKPSGNEKFGILLIFRAME